MSPTPKELADGIRTYGWWQGPDDLLDALQTQAEQSEYLMLVGIRDRKAAEAEAARAWEFEHKMMERAVEAEEKLEAAEAERDHARDALQQIVACDYRGNMPREQAIARAALGDKP